MNKENLLMKLIETLLNSDSNQNQDITTSNHEFDWLVGRPVIIRCRNAGVHFGYYVNHQGQQVVLSRSRRMYRWWAKKQMTLSAVAEFGLNLNKDLRIQCEMSNDIILTDACEILPCTKECVDSFAKVEPYDEQ